MLEVHYAIHLDMNLKGSLFVVDLCCDKVLPFDKKEIVNDASQVLWVCILTIPTKETFVIVCAIRDKRDIYSHFVQFKA